ncbi:MAG: ABC transporter permease [Deltaproteobacteria bacterium]|nr:MAG: ABC transporter permease [Deltaproteobacteria bacterium]TMQ16994.1 MAG: ABC transporter permease [Deltaproteobacteria bacterium]
MSWHRVYAIVLRYWYYQRHSLERLVDIFYSPLIELMLWGLGSTYMTSYAGSSAHPLVAAILLGICLWVIVNQTQLSVSMSLLDDMWNRNTVNVFGSPLRFGEWLAAIVIVAGLRGLISLAVLAIVALVLYEVNLSLLGIYLVPFAALLLMTGWTIGFLVSGIIIRYGTRVQALAWTLGIVLTPFSAIYYPLSALPGFARTIAAAIPMSYIFEGMREVQTTHTIDPIKLVLALVLNLGYGALALVYLYRGFKRALQQGLLKLF